MAVGPSSQSTRKICTPNCSACDAGESGGLHVDVRKPLLPEQRGRVADGRENGFGQLTCAVHVKAARDDHISLTEAHPGINVLAVASAIFRNVGGDQDLTRGAIVQV